jgi:GNAT superfamily N-acetyltransferase
MVVGPSGAGKTSLLNGLARRLPECRDVARARFAGDRALIDAVAGGRPLGEAMSILTACGLGAPRLWIRRFDELSEGERFRARLARSIHLHLKGADPRAPLLCDEFGSTLHRRVARAVAFNLAKLVRRRGMTAAVATTHEDLVEDLQPNLILRLSGDAPHSMITRVPRQAPPSFARRFHIAPGGKQDYERFAFMHYRHRDELGFVDRVFVLRDGVGGEPLGIIVYAYGPLDLALRNQATGGRFRGNPDRLNREMRIIRRLIIHPDIRGCGIGHWLVRQTLKWVDVPFVECLAAMGTVNPVFEKAGMERIGVCRPPPGRQRLVNWLRQHGVDPLARDFERQIVTHVEVHRVVADAVRAWYRATTGARRDRAATQSPRLLAQTFRQLVWSQPVYYLWRKDEGARVKNEG